MVSSPASWAERVRHPSLGGALGILFVTAGAVVGLRSLADNSFLTHLATGRLILESGAVPSADPYTFTAPGEPWVVQSWLASVVYATAESLGGLDLIRVVMGATSAVLAGLCWRLLRPAESAIGRLVVGIPVLVVGGGLWTGRPYMFGLVALALLVLAAQDGLDPRWLLPIGWIWVNVHGSFPLGIAYLVLAAIGTRLDGRDPTVEIRCLKWAVPGMLAGALGPLGIRVLLFPLQLLGRQELLANVVEWQAPGFTDATERAFLVQVVLAVVLLARRPSYRGALVIGVFTAAALLGSRNIVVASIVMLPTMAQGMNGIGTLDSRDRPGYARVLGVVALALGAIMVSARAGLQSLTLDKYPVDVVAYLEDRNVDTRDHHLAAPDYVGNFLEYVYGADGRVFYDDRFDMFPEEASDAALGLLLARPGALDALEPYDVELVTMPASSPTAQLLTLDPDWRVLYVDEKWVLACTRGIDLGGDLGRC